LSNTAAKPINSLAVDPRVDPRVKAAFADWVVADHGSGATREELLRAADSGEGRRLAEARRKYFDRFDSEAVCPSAGFEVQDLEFPSSPDGNICRIRLIRPAVGGPHPCLVYFHGGGMARGSGYDGNYRLWARMIASFGVAVAMVDFRNSITPSSVTEIAPFPGGLNDCVSAVAWVITEHHRLGVCTRVGIAGESGGANLALAAALCLRDGGRASEIVGVAALAPYIRGLWPSEDCPSSVENNGIFLDCHSDIGIVSYGIQGYEERNPLAWPMFASVAYLAGLPPTYIRVNECDPYRDDGILFNRRLLEAGVESRCLQVQGTTHAVEIFPTVCPDISWECAASLALMTRGARGEQIGRPEEL
jgi:acetyl esterase